MSRLPIGILCLLFSIAGAGLADEVPYQRRLNIYWTDVAPVLDGAMDDRCWQEAEVADDFRSLQDRSVTASLRSEVRACYDAEYLYFYYRLHDDEIGKLQVGTPEDTRDVIDVNKDVIELFLNPGRSAKAYYQFCATPLGARFDMRVTPEGKREVGVYTPDWQVSPVIGTDHWSVEFRIPIAELVFDGSYIGTPQPGDEWGINFCRDQGYRKEWSYWSPTRDKSFHRPADIGIAIFKGRKNGQPLPAVRWKGEQLNYGSGILNVENAAGTEGLEAKWTLLHDRVPQTDSGVSNEPGAMTLNYRIMEGGLWEARVNVIQKGGAVFTGRTVNRLPSVGAVIREIHRQLEPALKAALANAGLPNVAALGTKIAEMESLIAPLAAELAEPSKVPNARWSELTAQMPEIESRWAALRYDIEVLGLHPPREKSEPPFAWAAVPAYTPISPDAVFPPHSEPVQIRAAGGEWESFQLALMPYLKDVEKVEVAVSPFKGEASTLPGSCVEVNVVGFVKMPEAWGGGMQPDVLYPVDPVKPVELKRGRTQPLWINVFVPPGTPKGSYHGEVSLRAGGFSAKVPVRIDAFGFDLPSQRSVCADAWYWIDGGRELKKYYGSDKFTLTPELYETHLKMFSRYRFACYPISSDLMWKLIKVYQEQDGKLSFDFSACDWIFELGKKYGAESFGSSFGCNAQALLPTASKGVPVYDRATGKKVSDLNRYAETVGGWKFTRGKSKKSDFAENPVYPQFIAQLIGYLRQKGVLDLAHYEIYDEPKTLDEWRDVLKMHGFLKGIAPDLKLKSYGVGPWAYENRPEFSPIGKYDVWAPLLDSVTPARLEQLRERKKHGEAFWFYTCSARYRDIDQASAPHICLYQSPLAPRMHGWAAWKLKADGFLIFAMATDLPKNTQPDREKFFTDPVWEVSRTAGQGYLVYPGPNQEFWPSLRLAAVRDGLEDYELFKLLSDRLARLDPERDADLIGRIHRELEIGNDILTWDWHVWCKDERILNKKRQQIADLIAEADAVNGRR